jgi:hypothetical protein
MHAIGQRGTVDEHAATRHAERATTGQQFQQRAEGRQKTEKKKHEARARNK